MPMVGGGGGGGGGRVAVDACWEGGYYFRFIQLTERCSVGKREGVRLVEGKVLHW